MGRRGARSGQRAVRRIVLYNIGNHQPIALLDFIATCWKKC
jgi:hypothetical protein